MYQQTPLTVRCTPPIWISCLDWLGIASTPRSRPLSNRCATPIPLCPTCKNFHISMPKDPTPDAEKGGGNTWVPVFYSSSVLRIDVPEALFPTHNVVPLPFRCLNMLGEYCCCCCCLSPLRSWAFASAYVESPREIMHRVLCTPPPRYQKRSRVVKGGGSSPFFREEEIVLWIDKENWVNDLQLQ